MASKRLVDSNRGNAGDFIGESAVTQSCEPCMKTNISKTATVFCKDCDEYLCDACKNPHTVYKPGQHNIVNSQDSKSSPVILDMKGMDKCHEHGREIEFFCQDHSKLCCVSCVLIHRKCDQLDEIAKISRQIRPDLQAIKQSLIKLQSEADAIIADCKQSETGLNESIAKISSEVDTMKDRIIKLFEEAKQKLIREAKQFKTAEVKRIENKRDASLKVQKELNNVFSMCCAVLDSGTPSQQYIYSELMKEKRKTIESTMDDQKKIKFLSTMTVSFPQQVTSLLEMGSNSIKLNCVGNKTGNFVHSNLNIYNMFGSGGGGGFQFGTPTTTTSGTGSGILGGTQPATGGGFYFGSTASSVPAGSFAKGFSQATPATPATGSFGFGATSTPANTTGSTSGFGLGATPGAASTGNTVFSLGGAKTTASTGFSLTGTTPASGSTGFSVDFSKAYDRIHHGLLFNKLSSLGKEGYFVHSNPNIYNMFGSGGGGGFQFGTPTTTTSGTGSGILGGTQPATGGGFNFGSTASSVPAGSFAKGFSQATPATPATGSFGFGATSTPANTTGSTSGFGLEATPGAASTGNTVFSLGGAKTTASTGFSLTGTTPASGSTGFSFGATGSSATPGFTGLVDTSPISLSQPRPLILEQLVSVDLPKTGDDERKPLLTGLDFLPDGRLVAVDNQNKTCIILNERLQRLGTPYKFKSNPQCVVCVSHDTLGVTFGGGKAVCLLSVSTDNTIWLTRAIKTSSEFDSICCMSPSNMVVSTYNDPRPARMISVDGVETDFEHITFPVKTYKIWESKCTYVQSKNTLVLTDQPANTVYMYDTVNGTSRAVTNENIQGPRGACVEPGDTVLVCSQNNHSIVHLTIDGKILGTYPVDMEYPRSICVSKYGTRLAVSNIARGNTKLQLYKISPAMN
ncbi:keratin, type I cytoskeletal 9-like isoform X1 [Dreissena polymorpha]|uniref:keratin, type I cytoskeletal 9-like isoform X1 n=1 Tax=Dreissena polymorpha TaxID=45954 RepID=UPI00226427A3|nr:keratin, type I cytoskeletal 9-like isoform X1 [Dreissena polymorpha]